MKGSRYSIIKLVESSSFISDITSLLKDTKAKVSKYDNWMPKSIRHDGEAELKEFLKYNFNPELSSSVNEWWAKKGSTPNWDLISTCTIDGKRGLLLVEAKAHCAELEKESKGKDLKDNASSDSIENHKKIGKAIEHANSEIEKQFNGIFISRDKCYQLSNRVAHAWWLASKGIPVVLMYLGFKNVEDMKNEKNKLFETDEDWRNCFNIHAKQVGVDNILDKWVNCGESGFITICRSY